MSKLQKQLNDDRVIKFKTGIFQGIKLTRFILQWLVGKCLLHPQTPTVVYASINADLESQKKVINNNVFVFFL